MTSTTANSLLADILGLAPGITAALPKSEPAAR
jgi:hypothetical protein